MQSKILVILLLVLPLACLPARAAAAEVGSADLIEDAARWDGKTVSFEGEAIGEILPRGDHAWINVSDGENAIGCWVRADQAEKISLYGRYGVRGDTVRLEGVYHRACADHGGDLDLHADTLRVVSRGAEEPVPLSRPLAAAAGVLSGGAILLAVLAIRRYRCYNCE
ncbi:MAG: hypothetical protein LKJ80_01780 [Oscillibacter sp.]|jgi:hypothetical protein|nr:hypothetical protein [Oscillibacter sp.]